MYLFSVVIFSGTRRAFTQRYMLLSEEKSISLGHPVSYSSDNLHRRTQTVEERRCVHEQDMWVYGRVGYCGRKVSLLLSLSSYRK